MPSTRENEMHPAEQLRVRARTAADIQELKETFRKAREDGNLAVVVISQPAGLT
jgi:hypothetical protein